MGRRGRIRVKGGLPLTADVAVKPDTIPGQAVGADAAKGSGGKDPSAGALIVDVHGLELRLRNVYTGTQSQTSLQRVLLLTIANC